MGMAWGVQHKKLGEVAGENLAFLDFSAIVLTVPMPPKEKK